MSLLLQAPQKGRVALHAKLRRKSEPAAGGHVTSRARWALLSPHGAAVVGQLGPAYSPTVPPHRATARNWHRHVGRR